MRAPAPMLCGIGLLALLSPAASARVPRTVKLHFPRLAVVPGTNPEACVAVRLPSVAPLDVDTVEIRHRGIGSSASVQHFLVYLYTGEMLDGFPRKPGAPIQSRGCLDLGPADRDRRQLVASGTFRRSRIAFLPGGALRMSPVPSAPGAAPAGLGFVLDGEWVNAGTRSRTVSSLVVLHRARGKNLARIALPFTDRSAEAGLAVPPGRIASSEALPAGQSAAWGPGRPGGPIGDACVLMVTGQMHKRGRFFGVDVLDAAGRVDTSAATVPNPFEPGRLHFFGGVDFTDTGTRTLARPLRLSAGAGLHCACWADNGVDRAGRLGCEETPGVPPGAVGAPAKPCAADADCPGADPAYPGRTFTGACRPATLVAGPGLDDEVCRLNGIYVPADPVTGCDAP